MRFAGTPTVVSFSKKDDHLWLLRLLYLDSFHNFYVKFSTGVISISLALLLIFQTFLFLEKFDFWYFIKLFPSYGCFIFLVVAIAAIPLLATLYHDTISNCQFWDMSTASVATKKRIRLEALYFNTFTVINTVLIIFGCLTYMEPVDEFFPEWEKILSWFFRAGYIPTALMTSAGFYMTCYVVGRLRFEFYLLIDFLKRFDDEFNHDETLFYQKEYQEAVGRRLKFAIEKHLNMRLVTSDVLRKINTLIVLFSVAGTIFCISILVFFYTWQDSLEGLHARIFFLIVTGALNFIHIILTGQMLEDVSNELSSLLSTRNWYDWNGENKKIYLLFVLHAQNTFQLTFSQVMAINYDLGVAIFKWIYSMVSVLSQIQRSSDLSTK